MAAAGSKSFTALVSKSQRKQHVWRNLLQVLARELNPLEAAAQSVADRHLNCVALLVDAICHCFLMLALLRLLRRTRKNRSRQQSAASDC